MAAARLCALRAPLLHSSRRIHSDELAVECVNVRFGHLVDRPHGSQRADRGAEESDAGEKEKGLLFGGSWHGRNSTPAAPLNIIEFLHVVARVRLSLEPRVERSVDPAADPSLRLPDSEP